MVHVNSKKHQGTMARRPSIAAAVEQILATNARLSMVQMNAAEEIVYGMLILNLMVLRCQSVSQKGNSDSKAECKSIREPLTFYLGIYWLPSTNRSRDNTSKKL